MQIGKVLLKFLKPFNGHTIHTVAALLAALIIFSTINAEVNLVTWGPRLEITNSGDHNTTTVVHSVPFTCSDNWVETTGKDPDTHEQFVACESPDHRYAFRTISGQPPAYVLDSGSGTWVDYSSLPPY